VRRTLIWVGLLLLLGEVGLRARAHYLHGSNGLTESIDERDPLLGYRLRPGTTVGGARRSLSINEWGFRGQQTPRTKPPGTTRVAVLGDSVTFGLEACSDESVWVARMTARLNEASTTARYDSINGGTRGYTLATGILQLTERIAPFDPDIVIVPLFCSDVAAHARRQFAHSTEPVRTPAEPVLRDPPVSRFVQKHSLLRHLVSLNTVAFKAKYLAKRPQDRLDERGVAEYEARLQTVADICRRRGWRLILCTGCRAFGDDTAPTDQYTLAQTALAHNPSLSLAGLSDAYARYNEAIRRVATRNRVMLVDLDRIVPKRSDYFVDAVHLSDRGHRLVGEAVARAVIDEDKQASRTKRPPGHGI